MAHRWFRYWTSTLTCPFVTSFDAEQRCAVLHSRRSPLFLECVRETQETSVPVL